MTDLGTPIISNWAQYLEGLGANLREHTHGGMAASLAPLVSQVLHTLLPTNQGQRALLEQNSSNYIFQEI